MDYMVEQLYKYYGVHTDYTVDPPTRTCVCAYNILCLEGVAVPLIEFFDTVLDLHFMMPA